MQQVRSAPSSESPGFAAKVIRAELARIGISISMLAQASGVNRVTIHRILSGSIQAPRKQTLVKLSRSLGLAVSDLTEQLQLHFNTVGQETRARCLRLLCEELKTRTALRRAAKAHVGLIVLSDHQHQHQLTMRREALRLLRISVKPSELDSRFVELCRRSLNDIPDRLVRMATKEALRQMLAVELRAGLPPSRHRFTRVNRSLRAGQLASPESVSHTFQED